MKKLDNITRQNEEMWDSRAKTYDKYFGFARWTQQKLVSQLDMKKAPNLLDLACGTGWGVSYANSLANGHGEFYGIDLSGEMIEKAQTNFAKYNNIHFSKANVEELPFANDYFDYIICSNAFHHFSDPGKVVKEAFRVLKPQGRIHILDVTADSFIIRWLDRLFIKMEKGHVKIYSTKDYQRFFQEAEIFYISGKSIIWSVKIHVGEKRL